MDYKLSNSEIEFLAQALDGVLHPIYNKKIEVFMKNASNGERAARIFSSVFGAKIQNFGDWKEFDLKFDTMAERDAALAETNAAIVEWRNKWISENHEEYVENGLPDLEPTDTPVDGGIDEPGTGGSINRTKDWVTYLVIGAAAIVIVLLLWDRKKR